MTAPARQKQRTGLSPEWANLPRRRCDDCNEMYKPKKPMRTYADTQMNSVADLKNETYLRDKDRAGLA